MNPLNGLCCSTVTAGPDCSCVSSDRNLKENFVNVDPQEVLSRVAALPVTIWNYSAEPATVRHIGPMAQDFAAAFGVGDDNRHIHLLDGQGVALAAIKGLLQLIEVERSERRERVNALQKQNALLKQRLIVLEVARQTGAENTTADAICPHIPQPGTGNGSE